MDFENDSRFFAPNRAGAQRSACRDAGKDWKTSKRISGTELRRTPFAAGASTVQVFLEASRPNMNGGPDQLNRPASHRPFSARIPAHRAGIAVPLPRRLNEATAAVD